jgi:uncharacterized protein
VRTFVTAVLIVLIAYGVLNSMLWANQRALLYHPPPGPDESSAAELALHEQVVMDGVAWRVAQNDSHRWILFFHGNGSRVEWSAYRYAKFRCLGFNTLAPEYPGYGQRKGNPSEPDIERDARAAYDYLIGVEHAAPADVVIYGWSLGSAVAVDLASHVEARAVILENPPVSVLHVAQQRFPIVPVRWILRDTYRSDLKIGGVHAPMLFIVGRDDVIVPPENGHALFALAHEPKRLVELPGGHADAYTVDEPAYLRAMRDFLEPLWPPDSILRHARATSPSAPDGGHDEPRPDARPVCAQ